MDVHQRYQDLHIGSRNVIVRRNESDVVVRVQSIMPGCDGLEAVACPSE